MTLSLINPSLSRKLPAWTVQTIIFEPYREGGRHFLQAIKKAHPTKGPTPVQRVFHLFVAASLVIPVVNLVVYVALRYFVKPAKPVDKPTLPPDQVERRYQDALIHVREQVATIATENIRLAISEYLDFVEKTTQKLIGVQTDEKIIQLIFESVSDELESMVSQIIEIPLGSLEEQNSEAIRWQQSIWRALHPLDPEEIKKLIREGRDKQFLNQPFYSWVGATFFLNIAKQDRNIPLVALLKEAGADPAAQDFFGNTGLIWACANASNGMAREILHLFGQGAYLNAQCRNHGNTALHLVVGKGYKDKSRDGVKLACSNLDLLKQLIALKANVNLADKSGNTPLHLAYLRRDWEMVQALLAAGAEQVPNSKGQKPVDLLKASYAEACQIIGNSVIVYLLDRNEFERNLSKFA